MLDVIDHTLNVKLSVRRQRFKLVRRFDYSGRVPSLLSDPHRVIHDMKRDWLINKGRAEALPTHTYLGMNVNQR
jgi:hypothetical protein